MAVTLDDCKEISSVEYCELSGRPEFVGQTRLTDDNVYWMVFRHEGILYKTKHKL